LHHKNEYLVILLGWEGWNLWKVILRQSFIETKYSFSCFNESKIYFYKLSLNHSRRIRKENQGNSWNLVVDLNFVPMCGFESQKWDIGFLLFNDIYIFINLYQHHYLRVYTYFTNNPVCLDMPEINMCISCLIMCQLKLFV